MPSGSSDHEDPREPQPARSAPAGADPRPTPSTEQSPVKSEDTEESPAATGEAGAEAARKAKPKKKGALAFLRELPVLLLIAFLLALLIKTFLIQAFFIPSESMVPTLGVGDRVLVNKVVFHLHPPRRGDVIVFEEPDTGPAPHRSAPSAFWHWLTEGLGLSTNPEKDFIKRVIALPGETIEMKRCVVYIDGKPLKEPYLNPIQGGNCDYAPHRVGANSLFVMGDNRGNSRDSRFGLGDIPYDKVVGRAFVIIWPPSRMGWLRGA